MNTKTTWCACNARTAHDKQHTLTRNCVRGGAGSGHIKDHRYIDTEKQSKAQIYLEKVNHNIMRHADLSVLSVEVTRLQGVAENHFYSPPVVCAIEKNTQSATRK